MLLHRVWNILCLYILPALKKGKEPDCSLTFFFTASSAVYCATFLHDCILLERGNTAKLQTFPTCILSHLSFQYCLCSISGMIIWPFKILY